MQNKQLYKDDIKKIMNYNTELLEKLIEIEDDLNLDNKNEVNKSIIDRNQ